jgi:hypothetical protein
MHGYCRVPMSTKLQHVYSVQRSPTCFSNAPCAQCHQNTGCLNFRLIVRMDFSNTLMSNSQNTGRVSPRVAVTLGMRSTRCSVHACPCAKVLLELFLKCLSFCKLRALYARCMVTFVPRYRLSYLSTRYRYENREHPMPTPQLRSCRNTIHSSTTH